MYWRRRAVALLLAAGLVWLVVTLLGGSGDESGSGEPIEAAAEPPECAPPLFEFIRKKDAYSEGTVADAVEQGRFNLKDVSLRVEGPIDWDQNPNESTSFQGKLQSLNWLDPLLVHYYATGDAAALERARDVALDWIDSNPFVNPYLAGRERGDSKPWIDKVTASRVQFLAWIEGAAECEGLLSRQQRNTFREALETHGAFLADPASYHDTNHGLYANRGLYLLGRMVPSLPESKQWQQLAIDRFTRTLKSHLAGGEGFWLEHSASYQLAINRLVVDFFDIVGKRDRELTRTAKQIAAASGLVLEPDDDIALFGDSGFKNATEEELARADEAEGFHWLPKTGLAFVRRNEPAAFLSVMATFFSTTHKHADELSFDLYDRDHRIVSDTGLYHKDIDRWHAFQESAPAHSGMTVGTPTVLSDATAYGSALDAAGAGDGWYAILGHDPLKQEQLGVSHSRLWVYRPGYALMVVDWARSAAERPYTRWFQLAPGIDVERHGSGALDLSSDDGFEATLTSTANVDQKLNTVRGSKRPLQGFVFPGFRQAIPRWTASFTTPTTNLDAVATFGLDPDQQATAQLIGEPTTDSVGLRVLSDGADIGTILVARDEDRLRVLASPELEADPVPQQPLPVGIPGNG
jgi:hypothetical protein